MEHKHVFITGVGSGIGNALVERFLQKGFKVSAIVRKPPSHRSSRKTIIIADARSPKDIRQAAESACKNKGPITTWINNVGMSAWRPLDKVDEQFWTEMVDTNLKSVLFGAQSAVRHMKKGGVILNISSLAGKRGSANNSVYCATKFGVNGITQALAKELGPRGIRVNAVCPVYVKTPGLLAALQKPESPFGGGNISSYLRKFAREQAALRRLPEAQEVADLCLFLASPAASAITGQCINVDCGVLPG